MDGRGEQGRFAGPSGLIRGSSLRGFGLIVGGRCRAHGGVGYRAEIVAELFGRGDGKDGSRQFYGSSIRLGSGYYVELADREKIELACVRSLIVSYC